MLIYLCILIIAQKRTSTIYGMSNWSWILTAAILSPSIFEDRGRHRLFVFHIPLRHACALHSIFKHLVALSLAAKPHRILMLMRKRACNRSCVRSMAWRRFGQQVATVPIRLLAHAPSWHADRDVRPITIRPRKSSVTSGPFKWADQKNQNPRKPCVRSKWSLRESNSSVPPYGVVCCWPVWSLFRAKCMEQKNQRHRLHHHHRRWSNPSSRRSHKNNWNDSYRIRITWPCTGVSASANSGDDMPRKIMGENSIFIFNSALNQPHWRACARVCNYMWIYIFMCMRLCVYTLYMYVCVCTYVCILSASHTVA